MGGMTSPSPSDLPSADAIIPPSLRPGPTIPAKAAEPPTRLFSLVAAAKKLSAAQVSGVSATSRTASAGWQADGWEMYDLVGEQRFLANVLAGAAARARFYVGTLNHTDPLADPEPTEDATLQSLLDSVGKTSAGRSQLIMREYLNLFVAGEGYLVGIPPELIPRDDRETDGVPAPAPIVPGRLVGEPTRPANVTLDQLEWRVLSVLELKSKAGGEVTLRLAEGDIAAKAEDLYVVRVWRSHPARAWEADSPTRSSLPVLRELVGLTMAISSMVDSRLAGAGVFLVPEKAIAAMKARMNLPADSDEDPFTDALIEAMLTPISDRASAAAYVPLIIGVPDGAADDFKHVTFDKEFDAELRPLREEAIRRLALGQDAPPELLLGVGSMNHWGAWIVKEDVVRAHVEPTLALICDAFTVQYLRPAALAAGYSQAEADDLVVWYDVSHMIVRPNRSGDAIEIYKAGELSGEALRRETGFDEGDAPAADGDPVLTRALEMVIANPSLASTPGIPSLVEQLRAVMGGDAAALESDAPTIAEDESIDDDAPADGDIPETANDPAPVARATPSLAAAAGQRTDALHLPPEAAPTEDEVDA